MPQASLPWHPGENACYVTVGSNTTADIAASWDKMQDGATILQALAARTSQLLFR